jgi:hypothetical protein
MSGHLLIDQLVATYGVLNHDVRMQHEADLRAGVPSARNVIRTLRDSELRFSQDLKARISGQPVSFEETHQLATLGTGTDHDSTASLIAQFGTVRESTLAMLRALPDEDWDVASGVLPSIRSSVMALVEHDRKALEALSIAHGVASR